MIPSLISRRDGLAALASTAVLPLTSGCSSERAVIAPAATIEADARALLDELAENLLRLLPESATSLGINIGARAPLRAQLIHPDGRVRIETGGVPLALKRTVIGMAQPL